MLSYCKLQLRLRVKRVEIIQQPKLHQLPCSLLEASSRRTDIRSALMASPDWHAYVRGPLAEANARQDVMQWACGRPSKETLSAFKSTDDIIIDEQEASEEGLPNRHLMRYNSMEDDQNDGLIEQEHDQVCLLHHSLNAALRA